MIRRNPREARAWLLLVAGITFTGIIVFRESEVNPWLALLLAAMMGLTSLLSAAESIMGRRRDNGSNGDGVMRDAPNGGGDAPRSMRTRLLAV